MSRSRSTPSWSAAPQRAPSRAERLGRQEVLEQGVERRRPLEHGHVAGVLEDHQARVGNQTREHLRVADADQPVALAPDDRRGSLCGPGGSADRSASSDSSAPRSPGLPAQQDQLREGRGRELARMAQDEQRPACLSLWWRAILSARAANRPAPPESARSAPESAVNRIAAVGSRWVEMPAEETSTRRSTRAGLEMAISEAIRPPIELPTSAALLHAQLAEQRIHDLRVAGHRDRLGGHRRMAEAGEVHRDDAMARAQRAHLFQPVGPAAGQTVDEHDRRARSATRRCSPPAPPRSPSADARASRRPSRPGGRRARRRRSRRRDRIAPSCSACSPIAANLLLPRAGCPWRAGRYRLDDARNRQTGGAGLGLSIADRAIRLHGGQLRASNRPEGGFEIESGFRRVRRFRGLIFG